MFASMSLSRLASLVLLFLWMLCLAGLLVLGAWFYTPGVIDRVDQVFRQHYLYGPKERFAELIRQHKQDGNDQVLVEGLVKIIAGLPRVQKVDELASVVRSSYAELVRVFVSLGDLERARYWNNRWIAFDPRDIDGQLTRGRLLMAETGTRAEGIFLLETLKSRFPGSLTVANGRAVAWASTGELGRAFMEFLPFMADQDSGFKWQFGRLLRTETIERSAGDEPVVFSQEFGRGESVELHTRLVPAGVPLHFDNTSLIPTDFGFRKEIQHDGKLQLVSYPRDASFTFTIEIRVAEPETYQLLMKPEFEAIVRQQLQSLQETTALKRFERAHEIR